MNIIVLGGKGRQGSLVVQDLQEEYNVTVADQPQFDLSKPDVVKTAIKGHDLVVGTLPSFLGYQTIKAVIEAEKPYVDLSFCAEDLSDLRSNAPIIHDAGVAPGLSNLIVGRAVTTQIPCHIAIHVGGVAKKQLDDYAITWSPNDLEEEYTRKVRIIEDYQEKTVDALTGQEEVRIAGIGTLHSYYTDGLRSLLKMPVESMVEKTLRWPGHVKRITPWLESGRFVSKLTENYSDKTEDILGMKIEVDDSSTELIVEAKEGFSAMSRATAHSCAAFAKLLASKTFTEPGVFPPEKIGMNRVSYHYVLDCLAQKGIRFDQAYPFDS